MTNTLLLQNYSRTENDGPVAIVEWESQIAAYLQDKASIEALDDLIDECVWQETQMSVEKAVSNWKQLLTVSLLNHFHGNSYSALSEKIYQFERHPWNQNSQYFNTLVALNHLLARMPVPDVSPHLLRGGAALIDLQDFCPWLAFPSIPHHLEYGIFLCALALFIQREDLKQEAIRLVRWQIHTLDFNSQPFSGLFTQEKAHNVNQNLVLYYLLFKGAGCLTGDAEFEFLTKKMSLQLEKLSLKLDPLWILIEQLFKNDSEIKLDAPLASPIPLPQTIYDPSTALIGHRSQRAHAVCTLHGNQTGLGTLRFDDVEFVNYGPQYLPLGECEGFGIVGNYMNDQGERAPLLQLQSQGFSLKGCVRLVDEPRASSLLGQLRGIWLEINQEFKYPNFSLETTLLGLDGWDGVAMSFFVKAKRCLVGSKPLLPRSFDKYEGSVEDIRFEGATGGCKLKSPSSQARLQVISLAGDSSFWGADFLVAYLFQPEQSHYQWNITKE
jgi:hypothetical protein